MPYTPEPIPLNAYDLHYEHRHDDGGLPFFIRQFCVDIYVNVHDDLEILYVLQGSLRLYVDNTLWELHAGEAFVVNAGSVHFGFADRQTVYYVLLQDWGQLGLSEVTDPDVNVFYRLIHGELQFTPHILRERTDGDLLTVIRHLCDCSESREVGWKLSVIAAYYAFAAACVKGDYLHDAVSGSSERGPLRKNDISLYIQFVRYVGRHYASDLSLPNIAKALQVSESRLYKVCKKIQGYPPVLYIMRHRLIAAAQMLENSSQSITDICYACGFESVSYFITRFREFYGVTPHQFRTNNTE